MAGQDWPSGDTAGFLFPEELVEKYGLKEGDVFEPVAGGAGIQLKPVNADLADRMRAAGTGQATYRVTLQDLSKLT